MSEHQETLDQAVKRIEASFAKIESYGKKVADFRISAGKQLVELQTRIEAGEAGSGVKWWVWYAEHFARSRRDAQRVMALARAEDPEAAAEEEREKNREAQASKRARDKKEGLEGATDVSRDLEPPPQWTEEDYAAQIARDVEDEIANLADQVADLDLVRELVLQKLTFSFKGGESAEVSAEARKALYSEEEESSATEEQAPPATRRGRPPGSKNKPKVTDEPPATEAAPPTTINVEKDGTASEEDLTIPPWLKRDQESGRAA